MKTCMLFACLVSANAEKTCHAISPQVSDSWCNSNCNYNPPNCPASLCSCDGPGPSPSPTPSPTPSPSPGPAPTPSPTPSPSPVPAGPIDIIGYYGNSGNAVSSIPRIADIHANYNVIILTFASIDGSGVFSLDIQGPYEKDLTSLGADIKTWKAGADKWGRKRLALVSIGGQNGHWPSGVSASAIEAGLDSFMSQLGLDGLDVDLEGSAVSAAGSLVPVIQSLTSRGKVVTAAPEAAQGPLDGYKDILSLLTWVHPQFYNNPPSAVTTPYLPDPAVWPTPWTVTDWQQESQGQAFWAGVLQAIGKTAGLSQSQLGMLCPATPSAAGAFNHWDADKLKSQVAAAGVKHVGWWAIAYDNTQGWKLAEAIGSLNGATLVV